MKVSLRMAKNMIKVKNNRAEFWRGGGISG